jgi:hypothetical protein
MLQTNLAGSSKESYGSKKSHLADDDMKHGALYYMQKKSEKERKIKIYHRQNLNKVYSCTAAIL